MTLSPAWLGALTILALFLLIFTKRLTPFTALVLTPAAAALLGGFGWKTAAFMVSGIRNIAPIVGMFIFAILFFGILTDAGMMKPIIQRVLRVAGRNPVRIVVGTAVLAGVAHLDGSGAVTFLITIPAMRPLYDELGLDRRVLACVAALAAGVNFLPWSGPTLRASASLHIPVTEIFNPLIAVEAIGFLYVFGVAYALGRREQIRLGVEDAAAPTVVTLDPLPRRFHINIAITLLVMAVIVSGKADPVVVFLFGTIAALLLNYPGLSEQRERIDAHAKTALLMATILLAAGAFTGIMKESGMLQAMAQGAASVVPAFFANHLPPILGVASMPLSLLFDPDSFYFGMLPVLAEISARAGGQPVEVAQAALLGQMTVGFPVSPLTPATFLLVGLCGIELDAHQKFSIPILFGASLVMTLAALVIGVLRW